jgi:hypothetical protein
MTTLHLSHKENEKCEFEKFIKLVSKLKLKNKASSDEELITEMQ